MEAVKKKWFWGIFISLLTFFAMSHNASALNFNLDYQNYHLWSNLERVYFDLTYNGTVGCSNVQTCTPTNTTGGVIQVQSIQFRNRVNNIRRGDLIKVNIALLNRQNYTQQNVLGITNFDTNDSRLTVIGYNVIDQSEFSNTYGDSNSIASQYGVFKVYEVFVKVNEDLPTGYQFKLESSNTFIPLFQYYPSRLPSGDYGSLSITLYSYQVYEFVGSEENREVEEKTQEAVDESEAAGGSSSQSAQTGTTGLLNAITGAVNVISSASPTNCKINGNMGNLDMGQLDLCANPAPAFIQTIGSLILILMCVPLAISLFNRFIAIFRSFQS